MSIFRTLTAFFIILVCTGFVYAAPSITIIVENNETQECAFYNTGDEFVRYKLPSGWTRSICNEVSFFDVDNNSIDSYIDKLQACCQKQGHIFIEKNVGKKSYSIEGFWLRIIQSPGSILLFLAILAVFVFACVKYIQIAKRYRKNQN